MKTESTITETAVQRDWISIIRRLSKKQKEVLSRICTNDDTMIPPATAAVLVAKGLIEELEQTLAPPKGQPAWLTLKVKRYDVASYAVHIAWCTWCSEQPEPEDL